MVNKRHGLLLKLPVKVRKLKKNWAKVTLEEKKKELFITEEVKI